MAHNKLKILAISCSLALGVVAMGAGSASAAPLTGGLKAGTAHQTSSQSGLITKVGRKGRRNFLLGLGAAAVVGGVIAANNNAYAEPRRRYYAPRRRYNAPRRYYAPRRPNYARRPSRLVPWSDAWYNYCTSRFRSFNPRTGYYISYNRGRVFCGGNARVSRRHYNTSDNYYYEGRRSKKSWRKCVLNTIDSDSTDRADEC